MRLLFALLLPVVAHATCAVAVWTPERVVFGADSMERIINPDDNGGAIRECKIQQAGKYYVMISGITRHKRTGFDTFEIISESVRKSKTLFEAADLAMSEVERGYLNVLISVRKDTDPRYIQDLEQNSPTFAIAGFEGGQAYMVHCSFDKLHGHWTWTRDYYPKTRGAGGIAYAYLCGRRGVAEYKQAHPNWIRENPEKTIAGMIAAETRILPKEVGGPVSMLMLDRAGAHWRAGGVCLSPAKRADQ